MAKSRFLAQSMLVLKGLQMPHERGDGCYRSSKCFKGAEAE